MSDPGNIGIDPVRASRDGHEYHLAWAARMALEMLAPNTDLAGLTVEGFHKEDEEGLSSAAQEIADLVLYRGGERAETASQIEVVQFKYSIAKANVPARADYLKKTLEKFAEIDRNFAKKLGTERAASVLAYRFTTNRPFHPELLAALDGLRNGKALTDGAAEQAQQIQAATGMEGDDLAKLVGKLGLSGAGDNLNQVSAATYRTVANWNANKDPIARSGWRELLHLLRQKAGGAGQTNNWVGVVDLLGALGVAEETTLFPVPSAFPEIGFVVPRPFIGELEQAVRQQKRPVLLHAAGGMGKTVTMRALARAFEQAGDPVVLFDCFGGGKWRDPGDARHLPKRALPHIVNLLAGQGLCDLLLPNNHSEDLARAFRQRLNQAIDHLRHTKPRAHLVLILDAIDHAGMMAAERQEVSFAHLLLEALAAEPIAGLLVVVSCRTERRKIARGDIRCDEREIPPFTLTETMALVNQRDPAARPADAQALYARSAGNPRVLDALIRAGAPYELDLPTLDGQKPDASQNLDDLLLDRIEQAKEDAAKRGSSKGQIHELLTGLALLPPPVPLVELAAVCGCELSAVESFTADLQPLLEREKSGLLFKDEPTETLIRKISEGDRPGRALLVKRLLLRQDESLYAARALPPLLVTLGETEQLISLAMDARVPSEATSKVGQREIRLARVVAAIQVCTKAKRWDDLFPLTLEASTIAGAHKRSDQFLLDHPDLVALCGDEEALRRLSEAEVAWPGQRHAALALAYSFLEDEVEALRHARRAFDWLHWHQRLPEKERLHRNPKYPDYFNPAYAFVLFGRLIGFATWFDRWQERWAFHLLAQLAHFLNCHAAKSSKVAARRKEIIDLALSHRRVSRPILAAILHYLPLTIDQQRALIIRLASLSKPVSHNGWDDYDNKFGDQLEDAIIAASLKALALGLRKEAKALLGMVSVELRNSAFDFHWRDNNQLRRAIIIAGVRAALEKRAPTLLDIAPKDMIEAIKLPKKGRRSDLFEQRINEALSNRYSGHRTQQKGRRNTKIDHEKIYEMERLFRGKMPLLLSISVAIKALIENDHREEFLGGALAEIRSRTSNSDDYRVYTEDRNLAGYLGHVILLHCGGALGCLSRQFAEDMKEWTLTTSMVSPQSLNRIIQALSEHSDTQDAALVISQTLRTQLETEQDIEQRIRGFGQMARVLAPIALCDAKFFFDAGLAVAEQIGSNDFSKTMRLIELAQDKHCPQLSPSAFHDFIRIAELNMPEEVGKFAWVEFSEATLRTAGINVLVPLARWADREKAGLDWSLAIALTLLVRENQFDPTIAMGLLGLDEPIERHSWHLVKFAEIALPKSSASERITLCEILADELNCQYQADPGREGLAQSTTYLESHVKPTPKALVHLLNLHAELGAPNDTKTSYQHPPEAEIAGLSEIDIINPEEIDNFLTNLKPDKDIRNRESLVLRQMAKRIKNPDQRQKFLVALSQAKRPPLGDKIHIIGDQAPKLQAASHSAEIVLGAIGLELARRHAKELVSYSWRGSDQMDEIVRIVGSADYDLVSPIMDGLADQAATIPSDAWLNLARQKMGQTSPAILQVALEKLFSDLAKDLPEDFGDGPWREKFRGPDDQVGISAGLIWQRLGSPSAKFRWRAAHALRRLIELGRLDVLTAVVAKIDDQNAGVFQDQKLPFYPMHAKLWLLIALARIGKDRPDVVAPYREILEQIAFDETFPHVVIRHFAAEALQSISAQAADRDALQARLAKINQSPFELLRGRRQNYRGIHDRRPDHAPDPNPKFHFHYAFGEGHCAPIAKAFDLPIWQVEDDCYAWIEKWCPQPQTAANVREPYFREETRRFGGHAPHDDYRDYLSWHALMVTAGQLLTSHPVRFEYETDPWQEALSKQLLSRADGLWLADGTDYYPPDVGRSLAPSKASDGEDEKSPLFTSLVNLSADLSFPNELVVCGRWRSVDGIEVDIDSFLIAPGQAEAFAAAVGSVEHFMQYLPTEGHEIKGLHCKSWVADGGRAKSGIDRHDPYGSEAALERPNPYSHVVAALSLTCADPFRCSWHNQQGQVVFRAEAWGSTTGEGRYRRVNRGKRLWCRTDHLVPFLASNNQALVLLVKLKDDAGEDRYRVEKFESCSQLFILSPDGKVKVPDEPTTAIKRALKKLQVRDRNHLDSCFRAVSSAQTQKRKK